MRIGYGDAVACCHLPDVYMLICHLMNLLSLHLYQIGPNLPAQFYPVVDAFHYQEKEVQCFPEYLHQKLSATTSREHLVVVCIQQHYMLL